MNQIYGILRRSHRLKQKGKSNLLVLFLIIFLCSAFSLYSDEIRVYRVKHMLVVDAEKLLSRDFPKINLTPFYSQNTILLKGKIHQIDSALKHLELNDTPVEDYYLMDITIAEAEKIIFKGIQLLPVGKETRFQRSILTPAVIGKDTKMLALGYFFSIFLSKNVIGLNLLFNYNRKTTGYDGKIIEKNNNKMVIISDSDYIVFKIKGLDIKLSLKSIHQNSK